ncbi:MAG: hypothetical protein V1885_02170 [Candidatus Brennerbacteria bacterium]
MENQNVSRGQMPPVLAGKSRFWKFAAWFVGIIAVVLAAASLASYLSPEARRDRELQRNLQQAQKAISGFEEAMRADTYGGKTPQETLDMFVDALKKGDVELASKYFVFDPKNSREEWKNGVQRVKDAGGLEKIVGEIEHARQASVSPELKTSWFSVFNEKGETVHEILLKLNELSGVWKIESL